MNGLECNNSFKGRTSFFIMEKEYKKTDVMELIGEIQNNGTEGVSRGLFHLEGLVKGISVRHGDDHTSIHYALYDDNSGAFARVNYFIPSYEGQVAESMLRTASELEENVSVKGLLQAGSSDLDPKNPYISILSHGLKYRNYIGSGSCWDK